MTNRRARIVIPRGALLMCAVCFEAGLWASGYLLPPPAAVVALLWALRAVEVAWALWSAAVAAQRGCAASPVAKCGLCVAALVAQELVIHWCDHHALHALRPAAAVCSCSPVATRRAYRVPCPRCCHALEAGSVAPQF